MACLLGDGLPAKRPRLDFGARLIRWRREDDIPLSGALRRNGQEIGGADLTMAGSMGMYIPMASMGARREKEKGKRSRRRGRER
nr:hypothetical protein CFP56_03802 [Quercus suber]